MAIPATTRSDLRTRRFTRDREAHSRPALPLQAADFLLGLGFIGFGGQSYYKYTKEPAKPYSNYEG